MDHPVIGDLDEINSIDNLRFAQGKRGRCIEVSGSLSALSAQKLLRVLKHHSQEFALYDPCYPSPSDPGAYFSYSPIASNAETWRMTLGNHGWSGGIYEIDERTICGQLSDLASRGLLKIIDLDNVCFFSHYAAESLARSKGMSEELVALHAGDANRSPVR